MPEQQHSEATPGGYGRNPPPFLAPLRGALIWTLIVIWCCVLVIPLFIPISLLKFLIPIPAVQYRVTSVLLGLTWIWIGIVKWLSRWAYRIDLDFQGFENIRRDGHYFFIGNHQSWVDILMLFDIYHNRMPFPRWFMKRSLLWVPLIGYVCWAVDMPFMYRISPEQIRKNPKLAGKDLEVTRRSCEKFRHRPVVVTNYLEGTRNSPAKHAAANSEYRYLLPPKVGGASFVMSAMGELFDGVLDITLVYPPGVEPSFLNYSLGRVRKVVVRARVLPVPAEFLGGDLRNNPQLRQRFRDWINQLWRDKDRQIGEIRAELEREFGCTYSLKDNQIPTPESRA